MIAVLIWFIFMVLVAILLHISSQLGDIKREIEEIRKEEFVTRRMLERELLSNYHPELSDASRFRIASTEVKAQTSQLGEMLKSAKQSARREALSTSEQSLEEPTTSS